MAAGWAWWSPQGRSSGVLDLKGMSDIWVRRADLYSRWLTAKLAELKPDLLVIEQPFGGAANGAESIAIMHYLHRQTHVIGYRLQLHVRDVTRGEVAKSVLGWASRPVDPLHRPRKGVRPKMRGASKREVLLAINARHGSHITSDDEADAVAGLDMVLAELSGSGLPATAPPQPDARQPELAIGTPPARAQLEEAQAVVQIDDMRGPARRQMDKVLAELGIGEPRLPKPKRPVRGRRRSKPV